MIVAEDTRVTKSAAAPRYRRKLMARTSTTSGAWYVIALLRKEGAAYRWERQGYRTAHARRGGAQPGSRSRHSGCQCGRRCRRLAQPIFLFADSAAPLAERDRIDLSASACDLRSAPPHRATLADLQACSGRARGHDRLEITKQFDRFTPACSVRREAADAPREERLSCSWRRARCAAVDDTNAGHALRVRRRTAFASGSAAATPRRPQTLRARLSQGQRD
jgi:hypothetical protein